MKKTIATILLSCTAITGCGTFYRPSATAWVDCKAEQCNTMWARAQTWLVTNGGYRIQTVNDNIILTYGPHEYSDRTAFTLTKDRKLDGSGHRITITGRTDSTIYGSVYDPSIETNRLYHELMQIK